MFPAFLKNKNNFWEAGEEKEFTERVDLKECRFVGEVSFNNVKFHEGIMISSCQFSYVAVFTDCRIKKQFKIQETVFYNDLVVIEVIFEGNARLSKSRIVGRTEFRAIDFQGPASFYKTRFGTEPSFVTCFWRKVASFAYLHSGYTNEQTKSQETAIKFADANFGLDRIVIRSWDRSIKVLFKNAVLSENVEFIQMDMGCLAFPGTDISKPKFQICHFRKRRNRIVFLNDTNQDYDAHVLLANNYRQLKKKFSSNQDWTNAGDAYRSEMVMTRRSIWKQFTLSPINRIHLFFNWLIRIIYEYGSGYYQSLTRPLFFLALLILGTAGIMADGLEKYDGALRQSINAALPLVGRIPQDSDFFYLLVIERIFSVVFLTFLCWPQEPG